MSELAELIWPPVNKRERQWTMKWCPWRECDNPTISIGNYSQPVRNLPLNYNAYQAIFPTLAMSITHSAQRVECGSLLHPGFDSHRAGSAAQSGERSLHTGEVVGSIPTAPTIGINNLAFISCHCAHVSPTKPCLNSRPFLEQRELLTGNLRDLFWSYVLRQIRR